MAEAGDMLKEDTRIGSLPFLEIMSCWEERGKKRSAVVAVVLQTLFSQSTFIRDVIPSSRNP